MIEIDTLIIGANLAGLTLARRLTDETGETVVIEKSRSAGGRLSTRRSNSQQLRSRRTIPDQPDRRFFQTHRSTVARR